MKRLLAISLLFCTSALAAQTQHQAALSWNQSVTAGITSNKVYRSTVSGGPYTLLTQLAPASTSYTDTGVTPGVTYYYVVTALVGTNESGYSNQGTGAIPPNVAAPSGLTVIVQ